MRPAMLILIASLVAPLRASHAQAPELTMGMRVRLSHHYVCNQDLAGGLHCDTMSAGLMRPLTAIGTVVRLPADSVALTTDAAQILALPTASITRFEMSRGRPARFRVLGFGVAGGVAGLLIARLVVGQPRSTGGFGLGVEDLAPFAGLLGGFLLGAIVGAATNAERWRAIGPPGPRVNLSP